MNSLRLAVIVLLAGIVITNTIAKSTSRCSPNTAAKSKIIHVSSNMFKLTKNSLDVRKIKVADDVTVVHSSALGIQGDSLIVFCKDSPSVKTIAKIKAEIKNARLHRTIFNSQN